MAIRKIGNYYYLDIYIKGRRFRRNLQTNEYLVAKDRGRILEDRLKKQYLLGQKIFGDFKNEYLSWTFKTKPVSAIREEQRLRKILSFLKANQNISSLMVWLYLNMSYIPFLQFL